jgi:titin
VNDQAYRSAALKGAEGCVLVPFGDAGQPGASREFRTWIPVEPGTAIAPPAAPSGLRARVVAPYRIALEWEHAGDCAGLRVERKRLDVGLWFHVKTTRAGENRCQDDAVNVVLPGQTYSYRVCAFNAGGASAYSNEVSITVPALAPLPAPSRLRARAVSPTQVNLSWKSSGNNHEGCRIERKDGPQGPWQLAAGRIPPGRTTFHDIALEPGREYRYRVQAFHSNGQSDWTPELSVRTPPAVGRE